MKKLLTIFAIVSILAPGLASAYTIDISPNFNPVRGPFTIHLTGTDTELCSDNNPALKIALALGDASTAISPAAPEWVLINGSIDHIFHFPAITGTYDLIGNCSIDISPGWGFGTTWTTNFGSFNFVAGFPVFGLSTGLAQGAVGSLTDTMADPGTLLILISVIGLPLLFWVIAELAGLFPGKGRLIGRGYDAMNRPFNVRRRGGRKYREYWEDTKR